ncbi:MAG: ABC transporter permease [Dysgonamonadaceae bacterium]|jgi:ABC-2 type transport system permease protein|nr:ABC transporter permease [Dysgonamonadaceae bacterium]
MKKKSNYQLSIINCQLQKEFYHIFRDIRTMLVIIGIPVFQILIIGFAISTDVKNVEVAVYDPSNDEATNRIINQLDASEYFNVVRRLESTNDVDNEFKKGKTGLIVVFSKNFGERLYHTGDAAIQLLVDASDPNHGQTVASYAGSLIAGYQQELLQETNVPVRINAEIRMLYNPEMRSAYNFVPGLMGLIFMLVCAMMTSVAIVREKETGTMEVLLVSPVKPVYLVVSKLAPYFIISWVIFILILLLSVFVLKVPITGSLVWLNIFTLIFITVALSLGLLISTVVKTQVAAILASGMGLIMPVMILSGYVFPIESMPPVLQWISGIVPARWFNEGAKKLIIEGAPVRSVLKEMMILLGMAVFIITISLKNIKTRLE